MLNKVMLIGRLGRDPELRYTQAGVPIANLRIATDESYTDKDGNRQERTEWHTVVVFQRLAENCANYLTKGRLVYVEGSLQTRKWQDQQGQDRYSTEIKAQTVRFLERGQDQRQGAPEEGEQRFSRQSYGQRSSQSGGAAHQGRPESGNPPPRKAAPAPPDTGPDQGFPYEDSADMDDVPF